MEALIYSARSDKWAKRKVMWRRTKHGVWHLLVEPELASCKTRYIRDNAIWDYETLPREAPAEGEKVCKRCLSNRKEADPDATRQQDPQA